MNKKSAFILVFILALSAFLRLYRISDYLTFLGDEGRDVLVAREIIVNHKFTLIGPMTSIGNMYLGPAYYYMMILPLALSGLNPVGPAIMVALLGVATVYLIYKLGSFFDRRAGLIAAFFAAISPILIIQSHS
ncbi:MAG: glycosyltransferase family 39 protein, partial [bacterium]|nr:glycosyltransferase family 39 protein [bacterium]